MSSEVATGRSMKMRDGFMARCSRCAGLSRWHWTPCSAVAMTRAGSCVAWLQGRWRRTSPSDLDLGAFAQPVSAIDDHALAGLQRALHARPAAVARAGLHVAHMHRAVGAYHIDVEALRAAQHRGLRHDQRLGPTGRARA